MRKFIISLTLIILLAAACTLPSASTSDTQNPAEKAPSADQSDQVEPTPTADPKVDWPAVIGPDPSPEIAAFYYPWYFNKEVDGRWDHWEGGGFAPPLSIPSDYYPLLGTYSESDPLVLAQHFAWMREAGIGLIISSWWGIGDPTDEVLPLLLDVADHYGIKVGFHIEPYAGRSADSLKDVIRYIYVRYGEHPAFYWTTETSLYSTDNRPKGLFFLWATVVTEMEEDPVLSNYWRETLDELHAGDPGAIVITDQNDPDWVINSHFDGSYKYGVLDVDEVGYKWASGMPAGSWYIPGINPGFSARRIGYEDWVDTPRQDGATYDDRWTRMFDIGIEPAMVAITTFNEWHEGTQIEPAVSGMSTATGETYLDYESLPPDGYLTKTREWAEVYLNYEWPEVSDFQIKISTTSDWTELTLVSGTKWLGITMVSASEEMVDAKLFEGRFLLAQPLNLAESGNRVETLFDLQFIPGEGGEPVIFEISRGGLGATWVELYRRSGQDLDLVSSFKWAGNLPGRNTEQFSVAWETLFGE